MAGLPPAQSARHRQAGLPMDVRRRMSGIAPAATGDRMFTRSSPGSLTIHFEGRALPARDGDSIAAALLANNIIVMRTTTLSGAPRGAYCMMGACFECLAKVDGRTGVQTCMMPVRDGMRIERQDGARELSAAR